MQTGKYTCSTKASEMQDGIEEAGNNVYPATYPLGSKGSTARLLMLPSTLIIR